VVQAENLRRIARRPTADPMWPLLRSQLVQYRDALAESDDPALAVLRQRIVALIGERKHAPEKVQE